jgi:hypothetical protein
MTVEINLSSPSEIFRTALSSPAREQQSTSVSSRELEKARRVDDGELAFVVSPSPVRWPRVFPSL